MTFIVPMRRNKPNTIYLPYIRKDFKYLSLCPTVVSVWVNDINCWNIFMFHMKKIAHKAVIKTVTFWIG